jgi:hypothetical protein
MGITIHYRGLLADLTRIEDFEDRLLDLALEFGGQAQIWRSFAKDDPQRVIRGVILNVAPGQETTSLLVSPEGWLIGLVDLEDAEAGRLTEPPWCFIKTQFGPIEGHVALVELFTALKREFLPDLEVSDEGGYWETRDFAALTRKHSFLQKTIEGLAEGLERHGLSREAAEDPEILLRRIERIAAQVHGIMRKPAEHPPVEFPDDDTYGSVPDPEATEARWDELYKHNRRQQERMQRSLEERRSQGEDDDSAFENALNDLGLEIPGEEDEAEHEPWHEEAQEESAGLLDDEALADDTEFEEGAEEDDPFRAMSRRHPLLKASQDLLHDLTKAFGEADQRYQSALRTLYQGAGDMMGGLAQAMSEPVEDLDDYGLRVVQLKRALRGAAFARGAFFPLRPALSTEQWQELRSRLRQLEDEIFHELSRLRAEHRAEDR